MTMRWTGSSEAEVLPAPRVPRETPTWNRHLQALADGRNPGYHGPHVASPYFRHEVTGMRWWRCACGHMIHRDRPRPYPPRHA